MHHVVAFSNDLWVGLTFYRRRFREDIWPVAAPILKRVGELLLAAALNSFIWYCGGAVVTVTFFQVALAVAAIILIGKVIYFLCTREGGMPSFHYEGSVARIAIVNFIGMLGLNTLIHELGHAAMAAMLYRFPAIEIVLLPFAGGHTSYAISYGLTLVGRLLGAGGSALLCCLGGAAASILFAVGARLCAYLLQGGSPSLAQLLKWHSITLFVQEILYALTALTSPLNNFGHDFVAAWQLYGLHPLVPVIAMVALLATTLLGF